MQICMSCWIYRLIYRRHILIFFVFFVFELCYLYLIMSWQCCNKLTNGLLILQVIKFLYKFKFNNSIELISMISMINVPKNRATILKDSLSKFHDFSKQKFRSNRKIHLYCIQDNHVLKNSFRGRKVPNRLLIKYYNSVWQRLSLMLFIN